MLINKLNRLVFKQPANYRLNRNILRNIPHWNLSEGNRKQNIFLTYVFAFKIKIHGQRITQCSESGKDMVFGVPEGTVVPEAYKKKAEKMGYVGNDTRLGNSCWFTNLEHGRRHQPLTLMTMDENIMYSRHKEIKNKGYLRYDNYDAIEVPYTDAIPSDYDGVMGVPITFLDKYCPEQFEI